jgi:hypothetical protein
MTDPELLDDSDLAIIEALIATPKTTRAAIAAKTGFGERDVAMRLSQLEARGLVWGEENANSAERELIATVAGADARDAAKRSDAQ